jgi:hypothetical protein
MGIDFFLEFLLRYKKVMPAMYFTGPRGPGGNGYGINELGKDRPNIIKQRGFSTPGRGGKNKYFPFCNSFTGSLIVFHG